MRLSSSSDVVTFKMFFPLCRDLKSALRQDVAHEHNQIIFSENTSEILRESFIFSYRVKVFVINLRFLNVVFFFLW